MSEGNPSYQGLEPVRSAAIDARATFISRTYNHLFVAIVAFAAIEFLLFKSGLAYPIAKAMLGTTWLVVIGAFMLVSWGATHVAQRAVSLGAQYAALAGYVFAQAIVFVPLLAIAEFHAPGAIPSAGLVTMLGFAGLTAIAFVTRKDFSFLGALLRWGFVVALLAIVGGLVFGFELGTWFSVAMVGFAGAAILYDTSNVIHHYPENRYVAASLALFASVALMFWYVLRLFLSRR